MGEGLRKEGSWPIPEYIKAFQKREEEKKRKQKEKENKGGPNYFLLQLNRNSRLFTQTVLDAFRSGFIEPTQASSLLNVQVNKFSKGQIFYRQNGESYKDIAEKIIPDVLIEDDCESIGGEKEMTITFVKPEIRQKIKSIIVKEFAGIDNLPDDLNALLR